MHLDAKSRGPHAGCVVSFLTDELVFPPPETATRDGLVAIGGDLSVERLLLAYRSGIFPWPIFPDDHMTWFSPDPRAILELDRLHVSRSLAKLMRQGKLECRINTAFDRVIAACAEPAPDRPSTWITPDIMQGYQRLHELGHAHSVETFEDGELVGGLYGVSIGGFFAGESMFSRRSNASKVAVVCLVHRLRERGMELLDIQQGTRHMLSMGGEEIPRRTYLERLARAVRVDTRFD